MKRARHTLSRTYGVTKGVALENLLYRALQLPNQEALPDPERDCEVQVQRDGAHLRIDIVLPGTIRKKRRPVPEDPRTQLR